MGSTLKLNDSWYAAEISREAVVLLHGLGSRGRDWALQIEALRPEFPLLTLDLRGHGASPRSEEWPSMSDYAEDVERALASRSLPRAHIVGLSLGAAVGLQLAVQRPDLVRSLTLVNGFARLRMGWQGSLGAAVRLLCLLIGRMDWLGSWVARTLFPEPKQSLLRRQAAAQLAANDRGAYLRAVWALRRFNLVDELSQLHVPTLIVAGRQDPIVPFRAKQELADRIPAAMLEVIGASRHATPLDAPMPFNQILLGFLRAVEDGRRMEARE